MESLRITIQEVEVALSFTYTYGRDRTYKSEDGRVEARHRHGEIWKNHCWIVDVNGPWYDDSNPAGIGPTLEKAVEKLNECLNAYLAAATFKRRE